MGFGGFDVKFRLRVGATLARGKSDIIYNKIAQSQKLIISSCRCEILNKILLDFRPKGVNFG